MAPPYDETARLLHLLGAALRVEPALLRAARYLLPRRVDVGHEAAAWNHPHVQATPLALYYAQAELPRYRAAFASQPQALQQQMAALLRRHHAHLSPSVAYEETLVLAETVSLPEVAQSREFFVRVAKTLHEQAGGFADAARDWIQRVGRRQYEHAALWQHHEALHAAWAMANREALRAATPLPLPHGFDLARVSWLLAVDPHPRTYCLRQRGHMLYVEADTPATAEAGGETVGSPLALLRAAAPYVQVVSSPAASAERTKYGLDQGIPLLPNAELYLRTDEQELIIDRIARPAWAESIGRDAQGLFVTWADGQRRAYWVPPGRYAVYTSSGSPAGHLEIRTGYWADAAEALALLREGFRQPAWAATCGVDEYGLYAEWRINGVTQRMRWIAPGEFQMGSPEDEPERFDNEVQHPVLLTRGFWLADTTCTQALWQAVMGRANPSSFKDAERPVEQVSWGEVQGFLARVNALVSEGGFRLPTEAEWEYACRAGTTPPFWFGSQITTEQVNYDGRNPYAGGSHFALIGPLGVRTRVRGRRGSFRGGTVPVKALLCNAWGLYQMHGNVWEWCQDWYGGGYKPSLVLDPVGPDTGTDRVLRGGGWNNFGGHVRSASHSAHRPRYRNPDVGFRLARGQGPEQAVPEAQEGSRESRGERTERSAGGEARRTRRWWWQRKKSS